MGATVREISPLLVSADSVGGTWDVEGTGLSGLCPRAKQGKQPLEGNQFSFWPPEGPQ